MSPDELEAHARNVGAIVGNLLSLDLLVRVAIEWLEGSGPSLGPFREGAWLPRTPVTDPDSLGPMIDRFNALVPDPSDRLDAGGLVRLRDAIAHGRILATEERTPMTLVKYGRNPDREGRIHVETVLVMTDDWFVEQRKFTRAALMRAAKYGSGRPEGRGADGPGH